MTDRTIKLTLGQRELWNRAAIAAIAHGHGAAAAAQLADDFMDQVLDREKIGKTIDVTVKS